MTAAWNAGAPGTNATTGSATTYAFPSATTSSTPSRGTRRRQRTGGRGVAVRRSKAVGTVAAVLIFLGALLVGLAWFSPDHSSADTSPTAPPGSASPATATP